MTPQDNLLLVLIFFNIVLVSLLFIVALAHIDLRNKIVQSSKMIDEKFAKQSKKIRQLDAISIALEVAVAALYGYKLPPSTPKTITTPNSAKTPTLSVVKNTEDKEV